MNRKGMSQTLALIVAASVFMMTALTLIFMFQQGASDVNQNTDISACRGAVNAICSGTNSDSVGVPSVCKGSQGNLISGAGSITGLSRDNLDCSRR